MKKKGNKKMPRQRQEIIDNPIPTSLFFNGVATHLQMFLKLHPQYHKQQNSCIAHKQRCRDRVINDFLSLSRHLLVSLLFHELTSLHPPSFQRNDFSTCPITVSDISGSHSCLLLSGHDLHNFTTHPLPPF